MAEKDSGQERTEEATPRRLQQAREKGQIARSKELTTMGVMLIAASSFFIIGPEMTEAVANIMKESFTISRQQLIDGSNILIPMEDVILDTLILLAPFFIMMYVISLIMPLALGGWNFSVKSMAFKLEKVDPIKGLKRVFGPKGLVELLKALAKFVLITGVAILLLWNKADDFIALGAKDIQTALSDSLGLMALCFIILCTTLIVIALVDVPFQLWDHAKQLKMTKQELKDEYKETEGKPEVKQKVRNLQRELAQRHMMEAVPDADVIVTNPTHFSVALKYDPDKSDAPVVVALGADLIALKIREVARENKITVLEAPLIARALYYTSEINHEIDEGLFVAVAQILAYVFQLNKARKEGTPGPQRLAVDELSIPEELEKKANKGFYNVT